MGPTHDGAARWTGPATAIRSGSAARTPVRGRRRASAKDTSTQPASCRAIAQGGDVGRTACLAAPIRRATANAFLGAFTAATAYTLVLLVLAVLLGLLLPRRIDFEPPAA